MKKVLKIEIVCEVDSDKNLLEINDQVKKQLVDGNFVIGLGGAMNDFELDLQDVSDNETGSRYVQWDGENADEIRNLLDDCDVEAEEDCLMITKTSYESYYPGDQIPLDNPTGE